MKFSITSMGATYLMETSYKPSEEAQFCFNCKEKKCKGECDKIKKFCKELKERNKRKK